MLKVLSQTRDCTEGVTHSLGLHGCKIRNECQLIKYWNVSPYECQLIKYWNVSPNECIIMEPEAKISTNTDEGDSTEDATDGFGLHD